ncbi:MAG: iron complex outermembrane recepter protein [Ignavibacteria bacterium]|nr:MAG: iron complex outermembrane recepter protein [Ignavibacteria bacterium]KAF0161780.1 MAG: iron complex outermembrane recepter protein [Ignavibacteria bacterium]
MMTNKRNFINHLAFNTVVLFFVILFTNISASEKRNLSGLLIDSETSSPVPFASVFIIELNAGTESDQEGTFAFSGIEEGAYTLRITHIGYKEKLVKIKLDDIRKSQFLIYLLPKSIEISSVTISDKPYVSKFADLNELAGVLKGKELQKELGLTLAATLKNETGISIRTMGPAPARPVIRGLGGDRVFITEDGIKTSDLSATSPDHAVTIEPFSTERIEVIRGPKVLTKTPVTIGGVVNVVRNEIPLQVHDEIFGTVGMYGESANMGYLTAIASEIPFSPFNVRFEISKRKTKDVNSALGKLKNSNSENMNYSIGLGFFPSLGSFGVSYRDFELDYGVPGGFIGAHPLGVNISMYRNQLNGRADLPINSKYFQNVEILYANSIYRHKEFEKSGKIGSEFRIYNYQLSAKLIHAPSTFFSEGLSGISTEFRDFDIGGYVFTSPTKSWNLSLYTFHSFRINRINIEAAARLNYDIITPRREKYSSIGKVQQRKFFTHSLSASLLYEWTQKVNAGINLSKSSRVPTIEELYSEGPHLAAYSYEIGNPNLKAESGIGAEVFVYHKFTNLFYNINFFWNHISNYIIPRNSGKINYATFLPIYLTSGVAANLYGFETQFDWKALNNISLITSASYTVGRFSNGTYLPQIPPLKGNVGIKYSSDQINYGISCEYALRQTNLDIFEETTAGYAILNAYFQYAFTSSILHHTLSLNIDNILNKEYRNHLSRVKQIIPEVGINIKLLYKLYFHL